MCASSSVPTEASQDEKESEASGENSGRDIRQALLHILRGRKGRTADFSTAAGGRDYGQQEPL